MDNELVERVARAIADKFGDSAIWYTYESTARSVLAELAGELKDSERLDWVERLFAKHWDGTIGRPSAWRITESHRHTTQSMRGETFRKAIDEARHD